MPKKVSTNGLIIQDNIVIGYYETSSELLDEITIPANITAINDFVFRRAAFSSMFFAQNSNLTTIGDWAFADCTSLKDITLPDGTTFYRFCSIPKLQ